MELSKGRLLDADQETIHAVAIRQDLTQRLIGQPAAIEFFVGLVEKFKGHLCESGRPIGAVLETGPTGSGKTYAAEVFSESLQNRIDRNWKHNMLRIDCGEFQHSHEIAKLIGSPPGYLGHRETQPMISKSRIESLQSYSMEYPFAILVFDEIEKASDGLWNILLAVLDKGSLTLGTNETVDLSQTVIVLTSNAGFSDRHDGLGFLPPSLLDSDETKRIGVEAAKRKFSVEFINRLDSIIPFNALTPEMIVQILKLELAKLQFEVFTKCSPPTLFSVTPAGQAALLKEGYDSKYNARNIKRAISHQLRRSLARILGSNQLLNSEGILVDYEDDKYTFRALPKGNSNLVIHGSNSDKKDDLCKL
jgi:ATP-dependent Clp protease ATP-binding subunit ClpB